MTEARIELRIYHGAKPNGDRATRLTPCLRWEVWLLGDRGRSMKLQSWSQFDSFNLMVLPGDPIRIEVEKYVGTLASVLGGATVDVRHYKRKVTETWEADE